MSEGYLFEIIVNTWLDLGQGDQMPENLSVKEAAIQELTPSPALVVRQSWQAFQMLGSQFDVTGQGAVGYNKSASPFQTNKLGLTEMCSWVR